MRAGRPVRILRERVVKTMKKILFIGNSHTYFNDMAGMFAQLCAAHPDIGPVHIAQLTHGGVSLCWHRDEPEARFNIQYGGYDYVVLQQAAHPFDGETALLQGAQALGKWIRESGATPVLYMTWAQKAYPQNQEEMSAAYEKAARLLPAKLAPVGRAWQQVRKDAPQLELYYTDGAHASAAGSYLAACTILTAIFGVSPVGLPGRLEHHGESLVQLSDDTAQILQNAAERAVRAGACEPLAQ